MAILPKHCQLHSGSFVVEMPERGLGKLVIQFHCVKLMYFVAEEMVHDLYLLATLF